MAQSRERSIVEIFEFFSPASQFEKFSRKQNAKRKSSENFQTNFCSLECLRYSYCCIYSTAIKYTFLLCFQHENTHKLRFHIGSICSGIDREEKIADKLQIEWFFHIIRLFFYSLVYGGFHAIFMSLFTDEIEFWTRQQMKRVECEFTKKFD